MSVAAELDTALDTAVHSARRVPAGTEATLTSVACDATASGASGAALVHREQSFNKASSGGASGLRRGRYRRRSQSSRWLISDAVQAAEIEELEHGTFVDTRTGELLESDWVRPPRPARCSWRISETVPVHADGSLAHYSGLERCGSVWACPVCASVVRAERAREITKAVEGHQAVGGSVLFVTLTVRHKKADSLKQSMDAVLGSWKKLLQGGAWVGTKRSQGMKQRYDVSGYIRSTEVTYGVNGWHPHIHALVLTDRRLTDTEVDAFGDELHTRWARYAHKATGRTPSRQHGLDVQRVDAHGKVLGQYLSKMQDEGRTKAEKWDAAAELARSDVKRGRTDNFVPFELLDSDHAMPAAQRRRLWGEYVAGTKGRRAITWSRGLKDRFEVTDKTDEDIIDDTESATARWLAEGRGYDRLRRSDPELLAVVLEAAEADKWATVESLLPGRPPPDPDDTGED